MSRGPYRQTDDRIPMIRDTAAQDRRIDTAPRRPLWHWLLGAGLLLAVAMLLFSGVGGWLSGERSISASRLRIATVERGTLVRDAVVNGRVVAAVSPTVYAPVAATVELLHQAGDRVQRDDVLARLDSPELTNELARERSTLDQLAAAAGRAEIMARQAKLEARREADEAAIALTAAERDLQRTQRGFELGALPQIDVLRAEDAKKSAEIRNRNAASQLTLSNQSSDFDLETQQKLAERQRLLVTDLERRVADLEVRAPVDGIIGTVAVTDRARVAANSPLMTLVDLSRLEVELTVPESYADDLGIGMTAEVSIGTERANGQLSSISPEVVNGQVLARVRFDGEQPPGLRQNQRVSARVLIEERPDVLMLARGPFVEQGSGRYAWRVEDGIASRQNIRLGATSAQAVEVLDGLSLGDEVVVSGADTFGDAENVRINY